MKPVTSVFLLLSLLIPACMPPQPGEPTVPSDNNETNLSNSRWLLESFGEPGAESPVVEGSSITLAFGANGQAEGRTGCNSYGGFYTVQDGRLNFGEITSMLIACENQVVNDQEQEYFSALRTAGRFVVTDGALLIWYRTPSAQYTASFTI